MKNIIFYLSLYAYYFSIQFGAIKYLPHQFFAPGIFTEIDYSLNWSILVGILVGITAIFAPRKIQKPSELFFYCIYLLVYIPAISFIGLEPEFRYVSILLSFTLGVLILEFTAKASPKINIRCLKISRTELSLILFFTGTIMLVLLMKYSSVLSFASLDQIYTQREIGKADNWVYAYAQTYLVYFTSPFILAAGLFLRRFVLIFIGLTGFILLYSITAERSTILLPLFILIIYRFKTNLNSSLNLVNSYLLFSSGFILIVSEYFEENLIIDSIGFYYFTRVIAIPGKFLLDYYNFFSDNGYTFFSHIKGFDLIVDVPIIYKSNPNWPALGWIVGLEFHLLESNSNASFITIDGIASIGPFGPLLMCALLAIYVFLLDKFTRGLPRGLVLPSLFPIAFVLTNGSLFSTLLSYGGFMFLILYYWISKIKR
jgi:hypothetical protein